MSEQRSYQFTSKPVPGLAPTAPSQQLKLDLPNEKGMREPTVPITSMHITQATHAAPAAEEIQLLQQEVERLCRRQELIDDWI